MDIEAFEHYTEKCFQGECPPCVCECPLKVDVGAVIDRMHKENFTAAYRLFRNQALFPRIVSMICHQPCKNVCIRNSADTAVDLQYIEQACVEFTKDREPVDYNVPKKNKSVAIIGAGLSGLACALKLASKRYNVTVYEKKDAPGGELAERLPKSIYLQEFEQEFMHVAYDLVLSKEIKDLAEIQADAVYIATGVDGSTFGLQEELDFNSLGTKKQGVFMGGSIMSVTLVEAIEHGIRASQSIEKYLKVGLMNGVAQTGEKKSINKNFIKLTGVPVNPPEKTHGEKFKEQAVAEAKRCTKCDCSLCKDSCELMQRFKKNPKRITIDVVSTLKPGDKMPEKVANRLINSCNQCGLCETICPENVDAAECLLQARHYLFEDGAMPAAYHDFWLRDMEFANSNQAYAVVLPKTKRNCRYLFFPGCQLGASNPGYVIASYNFLKEICVDTSLLLGCCGVPADWAGDETLRDWVQYKLLQEWKSQGEPVVIMACPTCMKTFARYLPQITIISLYEVMTLHALPQWKGRGEGKTLSVFDPCASRYNSQMQESIRKLLYDAGYEIEELTYHGNEARCCSFGGHIQIANPEHARNIVYNRIHENDNVYATYCSNCRDTFAAAGKECSHILEIFFDTGSPARPAPDLSQRRRNRVELVDMYTGRKKIAAGIDINNEKSSFIEISPELKKKMNDELILEEDIYSVIEYCERTGAKVQNKKTGEFTGHLFQGVITFWATYEKNPSGLKLKQVYTHRMKIEENNR